MMRNVFLIILLNFAITFNLLSGQVISESPEVSAMLKNYALSNKQSEFINGWRVQILATTDRLALENTKSQFQNNYPDIPLQVVHNRPYYHLRAGAFYDKKEAILMKYFFRKSYPGAMEIADNKLTIDLLLASKF
ncbi:MAG: hypothetical protein EBS35_03900 [Bacteroidetes bacterium]|nr:hypothetical protein [Bacteroidota bacterium]